MNNKLRRKKLKVTKAIFYQIAYENLSDLDFNYDIIVLYSPSGMKALEKNYTMEKLKEVKIATFGSETAKTVTKAGLKIAVKAPTSNFPSMTMALENYLINGKAK